MTDPLLRERLYKNFPKILPFSDWYRTQVLRQKKSKEKRTAKFKGPDDFRKT